MTFRKTLAATTSALAMALAAAPALVMTAQTASAQAEEVQDQGTETAYSETDLDAFVMAFLEVSELRTEYTERLQQATDEAEQQAIVEEGNAAIVAAIDEVDGMDVELYAAILEEAGTDAVLNDRVTQRLQEATEG